MVLKYVNGIKIPAEEQRKYLKDLQSAFGRGKINKNLVSLKKNQSKKK